MLRNQTQYAIWDLDNCLSDDRSRIKLIDWANPDMTERYADYHAACAHDPARNLDVFHAITQLARPIFFTARPEAVRTDTTRWVRCELDIHQPLILMRRDDDRRPSSQVKCEMLAQYKFALHQRNPFSQDACFAAFDDREDIVDMYRQCGLNAALLSIHSVCAYVAPKASQ